MSLRFIIGPAGSGKTQYIIDSAIEILLDASRTRSGNEIESMADFTNVLSMSPVVIIVPDQATYQMEKVILDDGRISGFINLHVLGFRRLCMKVLGETGGVTHPFITPVGKSMAIQSILWKHRSKLSVYAPMVDYPGFRESVAQVLSEFNAYDVSVEDLRVAALEQSTKSLFLSQKLHDLGLIYDQYMKFLCDNFLDPDDCLELAASKVSMSSLLRGAIVYIDGFSGFTPQEYKVIASLLKTASQVNVALCMDHEEIQHAPRETSLFHPVRQVYEKITEICLNHGIDLDNAIIFGENQPLPRFVNAELAQIENIFRYKQRGHKSQLIKLDDENSMKESDQIVSHEGVNFISAANPRAEVEFVARQILKLVRSEGFRYKDITVQMRNLEKYKDLIEMVFKDYDIPFFLDMKRALSHHPLAELIRSAFDMMLTNFGFDSVFRYLKTDLISVERESIDELENYVLACGIRGYLWLSDQPWQHTRELISDADELLIRPDSQKVNEIRIEAMSEFKHFYHRLTKMNSLTAKDIALAVYQLLLDLNVPQTLSKWERQCEESADLSTAQEHAGIWDKVLEILEQSIEILGTQQCDLNTYALLVNAGLEDIKLGAIPPSLDQVLIGGLVRSRQPECKTTFLMGASEGELPMKQTEDKVFTDSERENLFNLGLNLEPTSRLKQLHEQYLLYIAITRSSQALYISYPIGDGEGSMKFPSSIISWLRTCLPNKQIHSISIDPPGTYPEDLDYVTPATIWGITAQRLSLLRQGINPGIVWQEAYRWMSREADASERLKILGSLDFTNLLEPLGERLSRKLYGGQPMVTSISKLERFQRCPFQHFAKDGLRLEEREIFKLDPLKRGSFFHEAMREFVKEFAECEKFRLSLNREEIIGIMDQVVKELVPKIQDELLMSSFRYQHISNALSSVLKRTALIFLEHVNKGAFRPLAVEVPFGLPGGIPSFTAKVSDFGEVLVRGRIDRIDVATSADHAYLRIVDYKSSQSSLDLSEVYYGLSLQLLIYLAVALSKWDAIIKSDVVLPNFREEADILTHMNVLPAGAVYHAVQDLFIQESRPIDAEIAWDKLKRNFRMSGVLIEDIDVLRLMDSESTGYSDILPVQFTKSGIGARSQTLSKDEFEILLDFVVHKVAKIVSDIIIGKIDIAPFRKNQERACTYCPYSSVCTFDVLVEGNAYNVLTGLSKEQAWERIRKTLEEGK